MESDDARRWGEIIEGSDTTRENPHEPLERAVEEEYAGLPPFLSLMDVVDSVGIPSLDLSHVDCSGGGGDGGCCCFGGC